MKTNQFKSYFFAISVLFAFSFSSCSQDEIDTSSYEEFNLTKSNKINSKKKRASASGQGGLIFEQGAGGFNGFQSFSFHVSIDRNGEVSGSWQSNFNDSLDNSFDINTHGIIDCVTFVGTNQATMSGRVTSVKAGEFWDSIIIYDATDLAYFEVIDNGEGSNSPADQFSDLYVGLDQLYCGDFNVTLIDISNGNIQVRN
jgi:hypothetical protein